MKQGRTKAFWAALIAAGGMMAVWAQPQAEPSHPIRIGMIGLDTSHVIAFTDLLNNPRARERVFGARVVAAFKGGSPDVKESWSRVDKYTAELQRKYGVKLAGSIEGLCQQVDAVMLESVDGRPHLAQARPVILAGKPLFIDKPLAGSLRDAIEIARLAKEHHVPWFSSSSYRFYGSLIELKKQDVGVIRGAISYGPCYLEPHHPDFFWYGIHPVEALYATLGTGCQTVSRVTTPDTDVATGVWPGGRVGTVRGLRNASTPHKVILFGTKTVALQKPGGDDYAPLVREIVRFFQTRISPVAPEETLELMAFMEAADESKRHGGCPVRISEVMEKAGKPVSQ